MSTRRPYRPFRFPLVEGGCRVRTCVYMAQSCPYRWHRVVNRLPARKGCTPS